MLVDGFKFNPMAMEDVISSCPEVEGCVMVRQRGFQTTLIVQPGHNPSTDTEAPHLMKIWLYVEWANRGAAKHGVVNGSLIMFTTRDLLSSGSPQPY